MRVPQTCVQCGKPRNEDITTVGYVDYDDEFLGIERTRRASFCSESCKEEFKKHLEP